MAREIPPDPDVDPVDGPGDAYARAAPRARALVGAVVVVLLAALSVTVVVGIVRSGAAGPEVVPTESSDGSGGSGDSDVSAGTLYVHVSGAVARPGLYRLEGAARLVDAIAAAGGFADDADDAGVNLARPVSDGEQIVVPVQGAVVPGAGTGTGGVGTGGEGAAQTRVNLNTATVAELDTLPRVGPAIAQRIVDWRTSNGRFSAVDDLLSVPGIGEKMLEALRPLVVL